MISDPRESGREFNHETETRIEEAHNRELGGMTLQLLHQNFHRGARF
jgi:hypothetical protein